MKKIAILHDHFLYSWWWERLVTLLAKWIDADLVTGFFNPDSLDPKDLWFKNKFITLSKPLMKQWFRHFKMMYVFANDTKFLDSYDVVLFSWNCIEAVKNIKNAKKIYYCHTPPRYLFDKYEHHLSQKKWVKKFLFKIIVPILRRQYIKNISRMDTIITNSRHVQERLKWFTWFDSVVVYPPVDVNNFISWKSEWFFLSYARLTDIKRVHMIAQAFIKMPNEKLIIIYNPSDPYLEQIKKIIYWFGNINLVKAKWVEIPWWVARCRATIYIPKDEDFWMTPVESMSAWKPVIWVSEWWLKETIIDWKTWILLKEDFWINDICKAVWDFTESKCNHMKDACVRRSKEFDLEVFIGKMKEEVKSAHDI